MEKIRFVFVSNYLNHHQIPFCRAMRALMQGSFVFVQTEPVEEERLKMGWRGENEEPYLKCYYEEPELCRRMILEADTVLFGGTDEESYIRERLDGGKFVMRYSERIYKTGQWKAISPKGLRKKYLDHTRYRNAPVYMLCSGAYVPSDFSIVHAYPGKMYCWGYFPETRRYDMDVLMAGKGFSEENDEKKIPYLLWSGRMIDWKHPQLAVETAEYLKKNGIRFHLDMIGGGAMEEEIRELIRQKGLENEVCMKGFLKPEEVRSYMERADIYLLTSDRQEGWGAVANEAMNSGCALVADHMTGAAPYLIRHGKNGFVYRDGDRQMLFETVLRLVKDQTLCRKAGREAYHTIKSKWNAENAAENLCKLITRLKERDGMVYDEWTEEEFVPCAPAPVISEQ
ncbi:MAG: glycosyltransferase, partial [Lachnospiraceae bacterium]|nr:glycosyltransferase [Lachnospiraceae bacterium]